MSIFKSRLSAKRPADVEAAKIKCQLQQEVEKEIAVMSVAMLFLPKDQVRCIVLKKLGLETGSHGKLLRKGRAQIDYKNLTVEIPKSQGGKGTGGMESPRNIRKKLLGHSEGIRIEVRGGGGPRPNQDKATSDDAFGFLEEAAPVDQVPRIQHTAPPRRYEERRVKKTPRRLSSCDLENNLPLESAEINDALNSVIKDQPFKLPGKPAPKKQAPSKRIELPPPKNPRPMLQVLENRQPARPTSRATSAKTQGVTSQGGMELEEPCVGDIAGINIDAVVIESSDEENATEEGSVRPTLPEEIPPVSVVRENSVAQTTDIVKSGDAVESGRKGSPASLQFLPPRKHLPPTPALLNNAGAMQVDEDIASPRLASTPITGFIKDRRNRLSLKRPAEAAKPTSGVPRSISPILAGTDLPADDLLQPAAEQLADVLMETAAVPNPSDAANTSVTLPGKRGIPAGSGTSSERSSTSKTRQKRIPQSALSATSKASLSSDHKNSPKESASQVPLRQNLLTLPQEGSHAEGILLKSLYSSSLVSATQKGSFSSIDGNSTLYPPSQTPLHPGQYSASKRGSSAEIDTQSLTSQQGSCVQRQGNVPTDNLQVSAGVADPLEGDEASPWDSSISPLESASKISSNLQATRQRRGLSAATPTWLLDENPVSTPTTSRPYRGLSTQKGKPWTKQVPLEKMTACRALFTGNVHLESTEGDSLNSQESEFTTVREPLGGNDGPQLLFVSQTMEVSNSDSDVLMVTEHEQPNEEGKSSEVYSPTRRQHGVAICLTPLLLRRGADRIDGLPFSSGEAVRPAAAQWLHHKKLSSLKAADSPTTPTGKISTICQSNDTMPAIVPYEALLIQRTTQADLPIRAAKTSPILQSSEEHSVAASQQATSQKAHPWWHYDMQEALSILGVQEPDETNFVFAPQATTQQSSHSTRASSVQRNTSFLASSQISSTQPIAGISQQSSQDSQESSVQRKILFQSSSQISRAQPISEPFQQSSHATRPRSVQRNTSFLAMSQISSTQLILASHLQSNDSTLSSPKKNLPFLLPSQVSEASDQSSQSSQTSSLQREHPLV